MARQKKIVVVIGTRPEAIKMAPIILGLSKQSATPVVCLTGQHIDMVQSVLDVFSIEPSVNFSIMDKVSSINETTSLLLESFESFYKDCSPDLVLVQGDTSSVLAGALAAYNLQIPIGHVEAGLRTDNLYSPWPEEGIRRMVTQIANHHFCPTEESANNVRLSGVSESVSIDITGNTVIDALQHVSDLLETEAVELQLPDSIIETSNQRRVLITGHRRENFGDGLENVCAAVSELASSYKDIDFVFPVHLNPNVQTQVKAYFAKHNHDNVKLTEPLSYVEFVWAMKHSEFIISDSGGVQEEAPSLGKPVLVTRDTTERPEGVVAGTVRLVGGHQETIVREAKRLLEDAVHYERMSQAKNPYGDGKAAEKIIKRILK